MRVAANDYDYVNETLRTIIESGGEGVILRKVGSHYEHGRSTALIKIKVYRLHILFLFLSFLANCSAQSSVGDKEAIVVGVAHKSVELKLYVKLPLFYSFYSCSLYSPRN